MEIILFQTDMRCYLLKGEDPSSKNSTEAAGGTLLKSNSGQLYGAINMYVTFIINGQCGNVLEIE